jgi:hypothetical protein
MKASGGTRACPVCGTENDDFAVVCVSCKGYIQAKVDTLDLFQTIWGLTESPGATFRRIGLARSKNYVIPLTFAFGIALVYALLWHGNYGVREPQLITLLGIGLLAGPVLGVILFFALSRLLTAASRVTGRKITGRNAFALFAYAASPVVLSLVLVFPIEIAVFGVYLFDSNPPPIVLNPLAFIILAGLDVIAGVWSLVLLGIGIRVMGGCSRLVSVVLTALATAAIVALFLIRLP